MPPPPAEGRAGWDLFAVCIPALKVLGKVMFLVVVAIVGLTAWAVLTTCSVPAAYIIDPVFCGLVGMLLWSYFSCTMDPGRVPESWTPPGLDDAELAQALQEQHYRSLNPERCGSSDMSRPRFCRKCQVWKPPRAHHCSVVGRCVLRMDHYCLWVVNTVGLLNYKAFLLFIFWTMLAASLASAVVAKECLSLLTDADVENATRAILLFITFIFDLAFAISLLGFLLLHGRLLQQNKTTIESFEKAHVEPWPFNKGWHRNFKEIFGEDARHWLVPVHTRDQKQLMILRALQQTEPSHSGSQLSMYA